MRIEKKNVKSVITKSNLPDADFVVNPYVGCSHGCVYCYADFMRRFTGHGDEKWGEFVDVKINADVVLDTSKIPVGKHIVVGSVCDPYQKVEKDYEVTRKCLEKMRGFDGYVDVITKSPLVLRDVDLLREFKNLRVCVSIGVLDDEFARKLEPGAPLPSGRVEVLRKLHDEGICVVLFMSPIFPKIGDVHGLINLTRDFVDEFWFENLNVRGNNREKIFDVLADIDSGLVEFYSGLDRKYWEKVKDEIVEKCEGDNLNYKIYFFHGEGKV